MFNAFEESTFKRKIFVCSLHSRRMSDDNDIDALFSLEQIPLRKQQLKVT